MNATPLSVPRISYDPCAKYPYRFEADWEILLDIELGNHDFQDEFGVVWLSFRGRVMILRRGYSWDGASMAPDFGAVLAASGAHDGLCQFRLVPCFPLSKGQVDGVFRALMAKQFLPRWIYWAAVRVFGGAYHALNPGSTTASCGLQHDRR